MTCEQIRRLLALFVGGQLDAGRHRAVELHVGECAVCAKELAELRATIEALHSLDPMLVPPGFVERVRARLDAQSVARFRLRAWVAPLAAVAALALGLGVLGKFVQPTRSRLFVPSPQPEVVHREADGRAAEAPTESEAPGVKETAPSATETSPGPSVRSGAPEQDRTSVWDGTGREADGSIDGVPRPAGEVSPEAGLGDAPATRTWSMGAPHDELPGEKVEYSNGKAIEPVPPSFGAPSVSPPRGVELQPPTDGGKRPSIGDLHTGVVSPRPSAEAHSAHTSGERASAWARSKLGQLQLGFLAENNFALAQREARRARKDAPIVVAALNARAIPNAAPALTLNVQSMRRVANAEVTLDNTRAQATAAYGAGTVADSLFMGHVRSRVLWKGTLSESDVKAIPLAAVSPAPVVQLSDIRVAATEAPAAGAAGTKAESEVVNFVLFVPPDLGRARPGTKTNFAYVQQPLDVAFADLADRSGLALLVRYPYGRMIDFHTPAVTAQQAIRMLAEQNGYFVVPDAFAWTLY